MHLSFPSLLLWSPFVAVKSHKNQMVNAFPTEIFLPSYIDHDSEDLERRKEPVRDIILTDEEAAALLPQ